MRIFQQQELSTMDLEHLNQHIIDLENFLNWNLANTYLGRASNSTEYSPYLGPVPALYMISLQTVVQAHYTVVFYSSCQHHTWLSRVTMETSRWTCHLLWNYPVTVELINSQKWTLTQH